MSMTSDARKAFKKLQARGVAVMAWGENEGYGSHTQFVLIHASEDGEDKFADDSGDWIRESWVNGQWVNPLGIRQDIHEILDEHELECEWQNGGQLVVFATEPKSAELQTVRMVTHNEPPPMSKAAFDAFLALARLGAPVWDWHSYSSTYDPKLLAPGTQFVMTCEPKFSIYYADDPYGEYQHFPETEGLRPSVHEIATRHGLTHQPFEHRYSDPLFPPLRLIAFKDPSADKDCRGVMKSAKKHGVRRKPI